MNPGDDSIAPGIRLERLRNTPVWAPALPSRFTKPASAPAAVVGSARSAGGGATRNTNALNAFSALSAEGRPSTFGSATTAFMYTHRREGKAATLYQPGKLAVGGRDNVGANALEGAAGLSFKLWSKGRGTGAYSGIGGGNSASTMTTANRENNDKGDQSSLGAMVSDTSGHFAASSSPAFTSVEEKGGTRITITTAAAAPTSDFGVTAAARQLGGGRLGPGVGSEASVAVSAVTPPDRPVGRLSYTLVQLSTRCVCAD